MKLRRVVTGQTEAGKSVLVSDESVEPITLSLLPGAEFHQIWGADDIPSLPTVGDRPAAPLYFPPPGGFRFLLFTLGPDTVTLPEDLDVAAAMGELAEKLPGMVEVMEPDQPGMHTTDTVDFDLIISGEVWLELDDGAEVRLQTGDCVIQNGTRHAWRNKSSEPCVMAVAIVGARRQPSES